MSRLAGLSMWEAEVSNQMSHLSKPQAVVLAMWSFSMVVTRSSSLTATMTMWSVLLGQPENTIRQHLREWYKPSQEWYKPSQKKKGTQRQELKVSESFEPLLRWVLSKWKGQQLAIALSTNT